MTVEIKICGMTNVDDVKAALDYGADYVGFVLYDKSARGISVSLLRDIMGKIPVEAKAVGVFVNESREFVEKTVKECGLYAAQLHGSESAEMFVDCSVRIWRAVWVGKNVKHKINPGEWQAERLVVDAAVPGMFGGSGELADWDEAKKLAVEFPVMLAGGLTPENITDAIKTVQPVGVDVASGVELMPGRKDLEKMKSFIKKVKNNEQ